MQRDLRHFVDRQKAAADRCGQQHKQEQPRPSKRRGGSSLLAALNGQLVWGTSSISGGASDSATPPSGSALPLREHAGNAAAVLAGSVQCKEHCQRTGQHETTEQQGQQPCQPLQPPVSMPDSMQPCPLCGLHLPAGRELQAHVEAELLALEATEPEGEQWEADGRAAGGGEPAQQVHDRHQQQRWHQRRQAQQQQQQDQQELQGWHQQQQAHQRPAGRQPRALQPAQPRQAAAPVLVLGGRPAVTAPTDRWGLQRLQRQRLLPAKRRPAASAFNFFDDGSGVLVGGQGRPGQGAQRVL